MSTQLLQCLNFGKDDAEADNSPGGLLPTSFLKTFAYESASNNSKQLFVGRKGSGKSAIALRLTESLAPNHRACLVTPDEISADEIRRFDLPGIPGEQAKCLLWRYIFAVQVARHILAIQRTRSPKEPLPEILKPIRQFLVDNSEVEDLSFVEKFWRIIERLKGSLKIEALGVKAEANIDGKLPGIRADSQIEAFVRAVSLASREFFTAAEPFVIIVDQVERVWSNDRNSDLMVIGLLLARDLKIDNVRPVFFLRTDIYELLQFSDRDKLRSEEFILSWDADRLVKLIERRAEASLNGNSKELWRLLPKGIKGTPIKDYLVSHTLMRPRDIIQLANVCRQMALTNEHETITEKDVQQALEIYSTWKINDLVNEWRVNYPYLNDILLIFANSGFLFRRTHVEQRLDSIKPSLVQRYPGFEVHFSASSILSMLYAISFVGTTRLGHTVYQYEDGTPIGSLDTQFTIHPCFRAGLRSTSAVDLAPFEVRDIALEVRGEQNVAFRGSPRQRVARDYRLLRYGLEQFLPIREALGRLSLPSELRDDIADNIRRMEDDLRAREKLGDITGGRDSLDRILRYFSQLRSRLEASGWADRNVQATLEEFENSLNNLLHIGNSDPL